MPTSTVSIDDLHVALDALEASLDAVLASTSLPAMVNTVDRLLAAKEHLNSLVACGDPVGYSVAKNIRFHIVDLLVAAGAGPNGTPSAAYLISIGGSTIAEFALNKIGLTLKD